MGPYTCICVIMDSNGSLSVFMLPYESQLVLCVPIGPIAFL